MSVFREKGLLCFRNLWGCWLLFETGSRNMIIPKFPALVVLGMFGDWEDLGTSVYFFCFAEGVPLFLNY